MPLTFSSYLFLSRALKRVFSIVLNMLDSKELRQNSYHQIEGSGVLSTGWLDPCIGVIAYYSKRKACVGHFNGIYPQMAVLQEYCDAIKTSFEDLSKVRVVVRGNHVWSSASEGSRKFLQRQRSVLVSALREICIDERQMDIKWGEDDYITRLSYNASTGKVIEETQQMER